jgi:hypothetical protein
MLDLLIFHTWAVALLWLALYVFDYLSTLWFVRVYQTMLSRHIVHEGGIELNPNFEKEVALRKAPRLKFILLVVLILEMVLFSWVLSVYFVEFLAGVLLLTWVFVDSRHLRNYAHVWFLRRRPESIKGRTEYSYWLTQKMFAADSFTFSLMYFFFALLTFRLFFLAGSFACLSFTLRHSRLANRKLPAALPANPPDADR